MLKFHTIPVTPFAQNTTVLWCDQTREAAISDPGGEVPRLLAFIKGEGLNLTQIILTHGHIDHVGGAGQLARECGIPILGPHPEDDFWLNDLTAKAHMFGFAEAVENFTPTRHLYEGDTINIGHEKLAVIHCPGHTPGHLVFYHAKSHLAVVGDVLFYGSIGRTDFPRGNHADLIRSIRQKLFPLGDAVRFIPGHGPMSTFGHERANNPFVGDLAVGAED